MNKTLRAHFYVLLATFIVAGSFLASQKLSGIISPISLTLYRFVIAVIILAPLVFFNKNLREKIYSTFFRASIISFFYSLYFVAMFKALETTTTLNTGTLFTLMPLMTAVLCIFFLKQSITLKQLFIYIVGIIGTCIVVFKGSLELFLSFSLNSGDWIFLAGTLSMGLYSVFIKVLHKQDDKILVLVFCTILTGCIWMFAFLSILGIPLQWEKIEGNLILNMIYLAIPATLFTVYLYQQAGIDLGPKKVMAYTYLNPASVAILIYFLDGINISFKALIGIIISSVTTFLLIFI